jgi:hypothetical protein
MSLRTWRFVALMLAALGMTMGAAHVLELAPKMAYDAASYAAVTSTLYRYFGLVGSVIQILAILSAVVVTVLARGRPGFRLAAAGTIGLLGSLALWFALVQPVNLEWASVIRTSPEAVPEAYARLRERWEYGHVAAFVCWAAGFAALLASVLAETPERRRAAT